MTKPRGNVPPPLPPALVPAVEIGASGKIAARNGNTFAVGINQ